MPVLATMVLKLGNLVVWSPYRSAYIVLSAFSQTIKKGQDLCPNPHKLELICQKLEFNGMPCSESARSEYRRWKSRFPIPSKYSTFA